MTTSTPAVIFGTGPLGQAVMRALLKRSQPVRMVNRSGRRPTDIPPQVEVTAGDAYDIETVASLTRGARVVYQCAQPAYHRWVEEFPALQSSILEGTARSGAILVVGENLYMYGEVAGAIHEGLPYTARTRKGQVRARLAQQLLAAHAAGKVQVAIGRGSDFYGPGVLDSTLGERAIAPILHGKPASLVGRLDLPHTYTFIDDFGEALVILGEQPTAAGQAWHVPNSPTLTQGELMELFFAELGAAPKMSGMGGLMMRLGGLFIAGARETVEMMYEFEKPFLVDSSKFSQAFGDIATPHAAAVRRTLAWYRQHLQRNGHH